MRKATMSFEERRKALREHMAEKASEGTISQNIDFSNKDLDVFLRKLDKFEKDSLKSSLMFK